MRSVPVSTPCVAGTTHSAPSAAASPAMASPWKSRNPGVSMRLILVSCHSANAHERLIEKPRSVSSGAKSVSAVPSFTDPCRFELPDTKASASTRLVFPLAPCPTTAMLRISDPLYSLIVVDSRAKACYALLQSSDSRGFRATRAGRRPDRGVQLSEVHDDRATRVATVADTGKMMASPA